jgi:Sigma-70, region 4
MPKTKKTKLAEPTAGGHTELSVLSEIARLLRILVGLSVRSTTKDQSQKEAILMLASVGCGHAEIASILGITPNSVGPALSRANRKKR